MKTRWIETEFDVYRSIYNAHHNQFTVFETFTDETDYVTVWGFKGADYPIIKCENRGEKWHYFLAANNRY